MALILNLDLGSVLFTILILYIIKTYLVHYLTQNTRAPGPIPLPFISHLYVFLGDIPKTLSNLHKKYGDIYEVNMIGWRTVFIGNPNYLKDLFSPNVHSPFLRRMPVSEGFKAVGMDSEGLLFNHDVPKWKQNRKYFRDSLSPPPFIRLSTQYTNMACDELVGYWSTLKQGQVVRLDDWYRTFTSDMMGLVVSGEREGSMRSMYEKQHMGYTNVTQNKLSPGEKYCLLRSEYSELLGFFFFVPHYLWNFPIIKQKVKYYHDVLKELTNFEVGFINARKSSLQQQSLHQDLQQISMGESLRTRNSQRADFLTTLLTENGNDEASADIIKQNVREMFSAGTGTTTSALCAIAYCLAHHPEYEQKMVDEFLSVLGKDRAIEPEDFDKLVFTECVINEALRLYPIIPVTWRYSPDSGLEIGGHRFPPNVIFGINLGHIQRDPRYFPDPDTFNPMRFTGNWREKIPQFAFSPFGHGLRACPGAKFAMSEIKVILSHIYRRFTFKLVRPEMPLIWKYTLVNEIGKTEVMVEPRSL